MNIKKISNYCLLSRQFILAKFCLMQSLVYRFLYSIISIIVPTICSCCQKYVKERTILCGACKANIVPVISTELKITKKQGLVVYAAGKYQDPVKKLVLAKNWRDSLAAYELAHIIYEHSVIKNKSFDYIVPIPLHWKRHMQRGYNQAEEIALILSQKTGIKYVSLLQRKRATLAQASLNANKRFLNVKDVFVCAKNQRSWVKGKEILLVDDVMTTGATLHAAGRALLTLQPKKISAVVAARGR